MIYLILRAGLAWILFLTVAFVNGAIRELVLQALLGVPKHLAQQLSCLSGVLFLSGTLVLIWKKLHITSLKQSVLTGAAWFLATAIFETFILNQNLTFAEILETYNLAKG